MQEWFVARRGIAYGVIYAGTSFAGLFFPVLLPHLFSLWGIAKTLRYLSIILAACTAAALLMIKPRLPERRVHAARRSRMWRAEEYVWLKDWSWLLFILANTLQGFAYYVPIVWLPSQLIFFCLVNSSVDQLLWYYSVCLRFERITFNLLTFTFPSEW